MTAGSVSLQEASNPGGAHTLESEEPHSAPAPLPPTPGTACPANRAALLGLQRCYLLRNEHILLFLIKIAMLIVKNSNSTPIYF